MLVNRSILKQVFSLRMVIALLMGFAAGLPLLMTKGTLQAWMSDEGVDLTVIGLFALVGLPYTLKFLWAPLLDRFTPVFLGRRRGWLLAAQLLLALAIFGMSLVNPSSSALILAVICLLVTFFSASQDIVIDAYRRESLADEELGLGSTLYVYGYRVAMLVSGAGALWLADHLTWSAVYMLLAVTMLISAIPTLIAREPQIGELLPTSMKEAVLEPFSEFFKRSGVGSAVVILAFILCYKLGDAMASQMFTPFYLDIGFTKSQIAAVAKAFGMASLFGGFFVGGILILKIGINIALWLFGILQAISTACFALLVYSGAHIPTLSFVIAFENLSSGMGTAAFIAFMARLCDKRYTATQYALLTSLMAVPMTIMSAPTGFLAKNLGWSTFFVGCAIIALPGLILLKKMTADKC